MLCAFASQNAAPAQGVYEPYLRVNPIFSSVLSQNSKLLVIAQLHPRSTEHLMSNTHLHNTIQHAFAALMQVQTPHLCIVVLSRTSCTHHNHQQRRQWIIVAVPTETKLGSTTFRFGSKHERKMSSIKGGLCIIHGGLCIIQGGSIATRRVRR